MGVENTKIDPEIMDLWLEYDRTKNLDVRNKLVIHYMPILKKVAIKVYNTYKGAESPEELVSEGMIALINAIDRFELDRDVKFETFVSHRVHGAMLDFINKQSGMVRKVRDISKEINTAKDELKADLGREPTRLEMAEYLGLSPEEYDKRLAEGRPMAVYSLDQMIDDAQENERHFDISSGIEDTPEYIVEQSMGYSSELVDAITKLTYEQQLVLSLFYKEELTIAEIAEIMEEDPKRVSQIRFQAIKKLRKFLE
ncbi:MAG: sigma-70 family RNA polymerase sigma factor [Oscillospiraceae bacterium]|nr:sigma-70 family RNA polymerase sigma factor [Oscillospiraceae bacterium]